MRRIKIFGADPTIPTSITDVEEHVNALLEMHPKAKLTPLLSSAVIGDKVGDVNTVRAQHVFLLMADWDDPADATDTPPAGGQASRSAVMARRTGFGTARR